MEYKMKVYITKHALTKGIIEKEARRISEDVAVIPDYAGTTHVFKPTWHETKEEAIIYANSMRIEQIAYLKKQITRMEKTIAHLEKLNFEDKE